MKTKFNRCLAVLATALLCVASGCATSKEKQTTALLAQAGFKAMPASTFEKQQKLKTIQPDQISTVKGAGGQTYYIYPVHAKDILYVGQSAEYAAYQNLLLDQQERADALKAEREARAAASRERQAEAASDYKFNWEEVWSAPPQ